jgi:diacylglycerol O-acyltransferase-1
VIENYMKYGVLVQISGSEFRGEDLKMFVLLYLLIPAHLFVGFLIELVASIHARGAHAQNKKNDNQELRLRAAWGIIAGAHVVNATLSLGVANWVVYYKIHHPLIGTFCEFHAGESFECFLPEGLSWGVPEVVCWVSECLNPRD